MEKGIVCGDDGQRDRDPEKEMEAYNQWILEVETDDYGIYSQTL